MFADDKPRADGKRRESDQRHDAEPNEENRYADEDNRHPCAEVQSELGSWPIERLIDW
jgi:hypothetical protein